MRTIHSMMNANHRKQLVCFCFVLFPFLLHAQSVVISPESEASPAASAILDVQSTNQGMLVPRMTLAQRNSIASPANGLLIYQTDNTPGFYFRNGAAWEAIKGTLTETDPQVGEISTNSIPVWDGEKLVSSNLQESGDFRFSRGARMRDYIRIYDADGDLTNPNADKARLNIAEGGYAYIFLHGDDNFPIVRLGATFDNTDVDNRVFGINRGSVYVFNGVGTNIPPSAGIEVDALGRGRIFGDVLEISGAKSFVEDHPLDPSKEIAYVSLEGPEAAMYIRGTTNLVHGKATISLPEHYTVLAVESSMTVLLTPLSAKSQGLAVTSKSLEGIVIEELMNGTNSYDFDWEIKCIRKGFEDFQVVREKDSAVAPNR